MNVREKMALVFYNKNAVSLVGSSELLKKEKAKLLCLMFKMKKSFIVYYVFFCVLYRSGRLVLSFQELVL